ncbi:hypothetical protein SAMN02745163_00808 [Clostridium cavendishii DSM 21758]|uniref:Peptidase M16C associated domain-containing protein n=1 Tax=Clostridium cavendishii DSM 21758 TaxID=1121302 RepID=A0A1M6EBF9_9CLOT|nr:insulinase family protein [Clostridium cavendishii]SHI82638.1 hypothetical protein SAMN02745163_00808 [Clostridium cavendishii DSM 21758]
MKYTVGNLYKGFKLLEEKEIKELGAKGLIFEHEKTGAKLIKLETVDDNKVFSIGFRTPPHDSTGVPHILEHSVLCGSRKYDTKEPFVELLKGSLNTFLNAMTFSDKTIYPVASRNEKDFFNLMDVYLDAVLYPNIYKHEEIFMQEGWHYNIKNENEPLTYNGVVYNEMKGAYSSPDSLLYRTIPSSLFPDNTYKYSSGGNPADIPNLTYKEFLDFHRKYYHPSNSYILLYGNGNIEKELELINEGYLKNFNKQCVDSEIPLQKPFEEMKDLEVTYGVSENETLEGKTFLSLNYVIGENKDPELYLAFEILNYLLLRSTSAPLKKALLNAGLGKSVTGSFDNSMKQSTFTITVKNAEENQKQDFKAVVMNTLKDLVKSGIDKEIVEASINRIEFELREGDFEGYPKGLIYYMKIMDSWLYGGKPFVHLEFENTLKKIKTALTTNYFEKLIDKYIINNYHSSFVILKPERGVNEKQAKELEDKLEIIKNRLSKEQINDFIEKARALKIRQETPDSKEVLEKIPVISLEDIDEKAERLPLEVREISGSKVLFSNYHTNKIAYVNLYFNSLGVKEEFIPYVRLIGDLFSKVDTKNYSYEKISNLININTGGISYSALSYANNEAFGEYTPYFKISLKTLESKVPKTFELLGEVLLNSKFDDENRIKQLISELKSRVQSGLFSSGHIIAIRRLLSYTSKKAYYDEIIQGIAYYKFLCDLEKNFNINILADNLNEVSKNLFNISNIIVNYAGVEEDYTNFEKVYSSFLNTLDKDNVNYNNYDFKVTAKNEALLLQGDVQYVAKGGNFKSLGYEYNGALTLLETIAGFDYLWNNVRVKGGAYGVFANFRRDGGGYIVSYRDPKVKETLKVYDEMYKYLESFDVPLREMQKYIIGTIRKLDHPLSNSSKCEVAAAYYLANIKQEDIQKERDEVLRGKAESIKALAPILKTLMEEDILCAVGSEATLNENKDVFKNFMKIIE